MKLAEQLEMDEKFEEAYSEYKKELLASYHDKGIHFSHICYTKK